MIVGYARTSTIEQKAGFEAQQAELKRAGSERIFKEQVSSVDVAARERLAEALEFVRSGDVFVVTKLDRLARSMRHLMEIVGALESKGVSLRILDLGIDTGTPTGKLILTVLGGIAEFERSIMLERQREGIAKAKADGKYKGRKPTALARADEVLELMAQGTGATDAARQLGIGRNSVYRIIGKYDQLRDYLAAQTGEEITLSFEEIEKIAGVTLPKSAYIYAPWWANESNPKTTHVQCRAWRDAGYAAHPDLEGRKVRFVRT